MKLRKIFKVAVFTFVLSKIIPKMCEIISKKKEERARSKNE